jgi:GNAT superfamily N-acetyltransferase
MAIPGKEKETLVIRAASLADAAQLAELSGQLGYPAQPDEMKQRLERVQPDEEHALLVAEQRGGGVVGWVHVFLYHSIENATRAEVGRLVVDERCRSQGVGHQLLARAEQWAREKGCRAIGLRSNVIRERAHAFYEREGYRVIKTQKAFRKDL